MAGQPDLSRQAPFWDARAADYPAHDAPVNRDRLSARLALVPEEALPVTGRRVLDIGAGTGAFALHAAEMGADVVALDVSAGMLDRLRAADPLERVTTLHADWRSFDPSHHGFERAFDIVWVQMVPSFREVSDFERMMRCSRAWCVFIGWGRRRDDAWLKHAFDLHDVPWEVPTGVPLAVELLASLGLDTKPTWLAETWERDRPIDAAIRDAADHLMVRGVTADRDELRAAVTPRAIDGRVIDRSNVEIGILAWRAT